MKLHIVMVEPEIPQNAGNIARACAITGAKLHLVHPLGFDVSEKAVKRSGLDYWDKLEIEEHESLERFLEKYMPEEHNMFLLLLKAKQNIQLLIILTWMMFLFCMARKPKAYLNGF